MINDDLLQRESQELSTARESLQDATTQLSKAEEDYKSAEEFKQSRAQGQAISHYERVLNVCMTINEQLRQHTEAQNAATIAPLRKAREEARTLAQRATTLGGQSHEYIEACHKLRDSARTKMTDARKELDQRHFAEAEDLAGEAERIDAELRDEVRKFLRDVQVHKINATPNIAPLIVAIVLVVVVVALLVIFGPGIWAQFQQFFFPPTGTLLSTLSTL